MDKWQTMLALDRFNNCIVVLHVIMEVYGSHASTSFLNLANSTLSLLPCR